jgi:hypothetical protein
MTRTGITVSIGRVTGVGRDRAVRPVTVDLAQLDENEFAKLWNMHAGDPAERLRMCLALKRVVARTGDVMPKIAQISDGEFERAWNGSSEQERWGVARALKSHVRDTSIMDDGMLDGISDILA